LYRTGEKGVGETGEEGGTAEEAEEVEGFTRRRAARTSFWRRSKASTFGCAWPPPPPPPAPLSSSSRPPNNDDDDDGDENDENELEEVAVVAVAVRKASDLHRQKTRAATRGASKSSSKLRLSHRPSKPPPPTPPPDPSCMPQITGSKSAPPLPPLPLHRLDCRPSPASAAGESDTTEAPPNEATRGKGAEPAEPAEPGPARRRSEFAATACTKERASVSTSDTREFKATATSASSLIPWPVSA